jgi:hypothetical protein
MLILVALSVVVAVVDGVGHIFLMIPNMAVAVVVVAVEQD